MSTFIIFRYTVADYDIWRNHFDKYAMKRKEMGLKNLYILVDEEYKNDVTLILEAENKSEIKEFYKSNEFKGILKESGVISQPIIQFLDKS